MFSSLFDSAVKTVDDFIEEPLQTTINITTQPIVDGCDLLGGLTEGGIQV